MQAIARTAGGRRRKRPTSSAVRCWASAALPPLPAASSRPPRGTARRPAAGPSGPARSTWRPAARSAAVSSSTWSSAGEVRAGQAAPPAPCGAAALMRDRAGGRARRSSTASVAATTRHQSVARPGPRARRPRRSAARPGRVGEQARRARRPARGVARRHQVAGDAVDHRVDQAADGACRRPGTPQAIASSGVMPNGSYQGAARTTSAERSRRARRPARTAPASRPGRRRPARRRAPAAGAPPGRRPAASRGGPPATTSSASGHVRQRPDGVVEALALDQPADGEQPRAAGPPAPAGPRGVNVRGVDPARARPSSGRWAAPIRASSRTSSVQVAMTRSTSRPGRARSSRRCGGLVSAAPWCRRLTVPSAWKVCSDRHGRARGRPAARPGRTSRSARGRRRAPCAAQSPRQPAAERGHVRQQLVLGQRARPARPARARRRTRARGHPLRQRPGRPGGCRPSTSCPAAAERRRPARRRGRSGRRRRRRRGRRAGWRARTPWRSSSGHLLQQPVPVGEEPVEAVAVQRARPGRLPACRAASAGRRANARAARAARSTSRVDQPRPRRHRLGRLGRGQGHAPACRRSSPPAGRARGRSSGTGWK